MFTDEELQDIGEGFYNRGNYAYALELFTDLTQRNPENASAYYWKGWCLRELGRTAEGDADLQIAGELNPYDRHILEYLASKAAQEKDFDRLRELMRYIPDVREANNLEEYFAQLFYYGGQYESAYRLMQGRHSWMIWKCLIGMGEYAAAKKYLEGVLKLDSGDLDALVAMGEVQVHLGEYEQAIECLLHEDMDFDHMDTHYYHLLGLAQCKTGQLDEAIESFETVIRKDASYLPAYKDLAIAHEQNGDPKKAVKYLKKAQALRYAEWHKTDEVDRLLTLFDRA